MFTDLHSILAVCFIHREGTHALKLLLTSVFTSSLHVHVFVVRSSQNVSRMKSLGFIYNLMFNTACSRGSGES